MSKKKEKKQNADLKGLKTLQKGVKMAIKGNNNLIKINDPNIINLYKTNKFKVNPNLLRSLDH